MTYRKKWAATWAQVRYCSDACRNVRITAADRALEDAIRTLLATHATIDPAEIGGDLEAARQAARRLVAAGEIVIIQEGRVVDPSTAKGRFRLRRA